MPSEEVLQAAAGHLVAAIKAYESSPTPAAADAVIAARLAVKEAFIAAGWEPPDSTVAAMQRDRFLLDEHAGYAEGQPSDASQRPGQAQRRRTTELNRPIRRRPTRRLAGFRLGTA